jgi:predicted flap endonuclease-1-like 5' DNA nuclease
MAERFTADLLFIVIVLLIAAVIGYLIGYYLAKGRYRKQIVLLEEEKAGLEARIRKLEEEKQALQADIRRMDDVIASLKLTTDKLEKEIRLLAEKPAAKAAKVPAGSVVTDDLKAVVGIGPKIARLLITRGITTWKNLAEASPSMLREILVKDGGERFRIHNPESWPHQARLLHEGRWDELKELQEKLEV